MNQTLRMPLNELCARLRSGQIPLRDYIDQALELLEQNETLLQTLIPEPGRTARLHREADALLASYPDPGLRPPLFGVLTGIKDLFNVEGLPTRAGSQIPASAFTGPEAESVRRLKAAGALVLGKTVSTEFAYFAPGPTRNPLNPQHSPGGSSSGSAAAVAADFCPLTLGTQTIASITRPAAYCGVYGFKPSFGRISTTGVFPFSQAADHIGYFCRHLEDIRLVAPILIADWQELEVERKPVLGLAAGAYLQQADQEAVLSCQKALADLQAKGFHTQSCDPFPDLDELNAEHRMLIAGEFFRNHRNLYQVYGDLYSTHSGGLFAEGSKVSDELLAGLRTKQQFLRQRIHTMMQEQGIDLWINPSATGTAPLGLQSTGSPVMSLPWTNAGLPSLSIPHGMSALGLPYGLQLVAAYGRDEYLLGAARLLERSLGEANQG